MAKNVLGTRFITQIGIIVKDIEATSRTFADFFCVDQPEANLTDVVEKAQTEYKGKSTMARAKLAFFDMGSLQLELIEPDKHPSTWREFLDENGEGVHHIAFVVDDMKEKMKVMQGNEMPLIQKGEYTSGRYAYMDTIKDFKVIFELLEND